MCILYTIRCLDSNRRSICGDAGSKWWKNHRNSLFYGDYKTAPIAQVYPFAQRMAEEGVACEMHVFDQGGHGLSLGNANTAVDNEDKQVAVRPWIRLAFRFLERHGF